MNVAVPPPDDTTKGKSSVPLMTAKELRKKKVKALKLCACYAFAVKHYLRGEDGLDWEDYVGILPPSVARMALPSSSRRTSTWTSAWTSYAATEHASRDDSAAASGDEGEHSSHSSSRPPLTRSVTEGQKDRIDATKRIRPKRSKDKLKQPGVKTSSTPLLSGLHQTIDFNSDPDSLTTPLPMV